MVVFGLACFLRVQVGGSMQFITMQFISIRCIAACMQVGGSLHFITITMTTTTTSCCRPIVVPGRTQRHAPYVHAS